MQVVYSEAHALHEPSFFLVRGRPARSAEQPERAELLRRAVLEAGHALRPAESFGPGPRAAVHTPEYLLFLETAHAAWQALPDAGPEVVANVHPGRHSGGYPRAIVGRAGWHMADSACPIGQHTFLAATAAADVAATAAELLLDGSDVAYALCRPPGHHAFADMAGGFCFLNNVAIAAQHLLQRFARVAVLDLDLHHGNGTQAIFYRRRDVFTVSLHADPADFYPFFWGYSGERGEGDGLGFNLNLPLPLGTGDEGWLAAFRRAEPSLSAFAPQALVVALGLDAHGSDPLAGFQVSTEGFATMATRIAALGLPTLLVQEGGYLSPSLGLNLLAFLTAFEQRR